MSQLGETLRQGRESRGWTLAEVEERTRIRQDLLAALENEDWDHLPEPIYVRGFVRSYASLLGLDPDALVLELPSPNAAPRPVDSRTMLDQPLEQHSGLNVVGKVVLTLLLVIVVAALAWWALAQLYLDIDPMEPFRDLFAGSAAGVPTATATIAPAAATPGSSEVDPTTAPTEATTPESSATAEEQLATAATPEATDQVSPTTSPEAATVEATPAAGGPLVVQVETEARSWIQVTVDGSTNESELLDVGETRIWTATQTISLLIGNAGGTLVTLNDEPLGFLGERGEVIEVTYTPEPAL